MSRPPTSAPRPSQQTDRTAEQAAYEYLTNVLNTPWNAPIEIEILPPALQADEFAVRVLDNSIGVPYTLLSLAFQYARLLFSSGLPQAREQGLGRWEDFQVRKMLAVEFRNSNSLTVGSTQCPALKSCSSSIRHTYRLQTHANAYSSGSPTPPFSPNRALWTKSFATSYGSSTLFRLLL